MSKRYLVGNSRGWGPVETRGVDGTLDSEMETKESSVAALAIMMAGLDWSRKRCNCSVTLRHMAVASRHVAVSREQAAVALVRRGVLPVPLAMMGVAMLLALDTRRVSVTTHRMSGDSTDVTRRAHPCRGIAIVIPSQTIISVRRLIGLSGVPVRIPKEALLVIVLPGCSLGHAMSVSPPTCALV